MISKVFFIRFWLGVILVIFLATDTCSQIGFMQNQYFPVGSFPEVVAIGDLTGDGLNDVVLGTSFYFDPQHDYHIYVFRQDPFTGLNNMVAYPYSPVYSGLRAIDIGDVSNDQRNDVIIGYSDSIGIFYQNATGTLDPVVNFYSGRSVDGVKTGDLNHDGLTDIAVSHWNAAYLRIFYQNPGGGFRTTDYPKPQAGWDEIEVADLNGDGLDDVVFLAGQGIGGIHVFLQNSNGTLNSYVSYFASNLTFGGLNGIGTGDLNNDGLTDVVASAGGNSPNARMVIWFQNPLTHTLISPPVYFQCYDIPEPVEVDDLNCDGHNDIVTVHGGWDRLSVFEQSTTGQYGQALGFFLPYASHYQLEGLAIGDINRDNKKDIAIADYNSGLIVMHNNSSPQNWITTGVVVAHDTMVYSTHFDSLFHITVSTDTLNHYGIRRVDSMLVISTWFDKTIRHDTMIIRTATLCGEVFHDTLHRSVLINETILIGIDTLLVSSRTDSTNLVPKILVYPNPTEGPVNIELPTPYDLQPLKIRIFSNTGDLVYRATSAPPGNRRTLDLGKLANAAYHLELTTSDQQFLFTIVVVK
jgi:hypothetical protein